MRYDPDKHHRRSVRLKKYDYSQKGAYFVTLCAQNREPMFGEIVGEELRLNDAGRMVEAEWSRLASEFPFVEIDARVVMPNHFHGILFIVGANLVFAPDSIIGQDSVVGGQGDHKDRPYENRPFGTLPGTLGRVVQAFKSRTTHGYVMGVRHNGWSAFPGRLWQRNYYEHVIRDEADLNRLRDYIATNPTRWALDQLNPANPSKW